MKILITGAGGFIGFHLSKLLAATTDLDIVGIDNLNSYYDIDLKLARLRALGFNTEGLAPGKMLQSNEHPSLRFLQLDLVDQEGIQSLFREESFDYVINLAAQAGVRYSLEAPHSYASSNVQGFLNILEAARHYPVKHLIYASSSSVYGLNSEIPFQEDHRVDHPVSLYAATKRSNELMAHSYSYLYGIPCTGLRFFTVYGAYGRPDMAYHIFTKKILAGETIQVFNYGKMKRDFTYVDDITNSISKLIALPPEGTAFGEESFRKKAPSRILNIGNNQPVDLMEFIQTLEQLLETKANIDLQPMQPGDVEITYADANALASLIDYQPSTSLEEGLKVFVDWYQSYYQASKIN